MAPKIKDVYRKDEAKVPPGATQVPNEPSEDDAEFLKNSNRPVPGSQEYYSKYFRDELPRFGLNMDSMSPRALLTNAGVFDDRGKLIWYGDLGVREVNHLLRGLQDGEVLFVLPEGEWRDIRDSGKRWNRSLEDLRRKAFFYIDNMGVYDVRQGARRSEFSPEDISYDAEKDGGWPSGWPMPK